MKTTSDNTGKREELSTCCKAPIIVRQVFSIGGALCDYKACKSCLKPCDLSPSEEKNSHTAAKSSLDRSSEGKEVPPDQREMETSIFVMKEYTGLPLEDRKACALMISALCKDDKEQMNRIEAMLLRIVKS